MTPKTHIQDVLPDHAAVRSGTSVFIALVGHPERVACFKDWLAANWPDAAAQGTDFPYERFGEHKELVFEIYDVILRLWFPSEDRAAAFIGDIGTGVSR